MSERTVVDVDVAITWYRIKWAIDVYSYAVHSYLLVDLVCYVCTNDLCMRINIRRNALLLCDYWYFFLFVGQKYLGTNVCTCFVYTHIPIQNPVHSEFCVVMALIRLVYFYKSENYLFYKILKIPAHVHLHIHHSARDFGI